MKTMPSRPNPAPSAAQARTRARGRRSLVAAALVADGGVLAWLLLAMGGLDPALLIVAVFFGWLVALALVWYGRGTALADRRSRIGVAALLGAWVVVGGLLLDWVVAITVLEGALGPLDYVAQRYGVVIPVLALLVGPGMAAFRAR
jgi:hypothetical protein